MTAACRSIHILQQCLVTFRDILSRAAHDQLIVDRIAAQPHELARVVLIDNAGIQKRTPVEKKWRQWAKQWLYLYYLLPYNPELNRIEILWKHASTSGAASLPRTVRIFSTKFSP